MLNTPVEEGIVVKGTLASVLDTTAEVGTVDESTASALDLVARPLVAGELVHGLEMPNKVDVYVVG